MQKAKITVSITKEVPMNGKTLDELVAEADRSFYDFLFTGNKENMEADIHGEIVV